MSYRFESGENTSDAVRRIAREQIDKALAHIAERETNVDAAIHDTRVCFKRVRGLLRLIRADLGDERYHEENDFYRDANRRLSTVRDAAALAETLAKLKHRYAAQLAHDAFYALHETLSRSAHTDRGEKQSALEEIGDVLVEARNRISKWSIESCDFSQLGLCLRHVYELGQKRFAKADDEQTAKAFHEWRKQVKYHWYHVRLLRPLWPELFKQLAIELKTLSGYLSEDHDLALLRERVLEEQTNNDKSTEDAEALVALINQRRAELELQARILGRRIYSEDSKALEERFQQYWLAWQAEMDHHPITAVMSQS